MNMIQSILSSPHFEKTAYILFGSFVTVVLTYICQRLLIREQYKMQRRLDEAKRQRDADEIRQRLDKRKREIETSIREMNAFLTETEKYIAIGVTLPNNTVEAFVVRSVSFKVKNDGYPSTARYGVPLPVSAVVRV
jgi:hypothetical protein